MKMRLQAALVLAGVLSASGTAFSAQDPAREDVGTIFVGPDPAVAEPGTLRYEPQGAVIYDNGPIITHPTGGAGGLAASALQTALSMTIYGFGHALSAGIRVADEFTVPVGSTWTIDTITFFAYQTGSTTTSTINHVNLRIWNGPPNNPASTVVFGDTATNRLAASTFFNTYRVLDTGLTATTRPVMANEVTVATTLAAGTYWLDWQTGGTLASGPWVPPVTILGQTTTGNAMQQISGTWAALTDVGPQGLPFILNGPNVTVSAISNAVDAAGNGVLQPGETVIMAPTWRNTGSSAVALTGALTNFTGPVGGTYNIVDGAADYGSIAPATNQSCGANCYSLNVTAATRPALHWDSSVVETVNPSATAKTWTLHVGDSFTDVLPANAFYRFVETIFHKGVTGGCGATTYCPTADTTREQMSVFVLTAKGVPAPVACVAGSEMFLDVPASSPFCRWIEELVRRGIASGCAPQLYCPTAPATREQMAVFVLKTLDPMLNPPACVPPNLFLDVPETSGFCRWIEELANRGIVTGCGGGNYCPTAAVTREAMSVFLAVTFSLTLYGV